MNSNKFKIGLFGINSSSGLSLTKYKNRWKATWDEMYELIKFADKKNFDFILPLSKWKDWGGSTEPNKISYETFNFSSLLLPITKKIFFFSTIHVPFVHPVYAAKVISTINSAHPKRLGLNIVCGWNENEYQMFYKQNDNFSKERYLYGEEWVKIYDRCLKVKNFSFKGNFFNIKNASVYPKNRNSIPLVSAAYSEEGRKFAMKNCNYLFTMFENFQRTKKLNEELISRAKINKKNIKIFTPIHIICRKTESEADDFHDYYSIKKKDEKAVNNFINNVAVANKKTLHKIMKSKSNIIASSCGSKIIKGNPKQVAEQLRELKNAKFSGAAFSFVNYLDEIKFFTKKVLSQKPFD
jgi:dimethylsulfone monooxygenase